MTRRALPFATVVVLVAGVALGGTVTKLGVTVKYPTTWQVNANVSGPLALDNFSGAYLEGGLVPRGGASVDITRKPLPDGTLDDTVATERARTGIDDKSSVTGGVKGLRVTYHFDIPPDYAEKDVAVYVPHAGYLYSFFLTYNGGDSSEPRYSSYFNSMLNSVQFTGQ
jgi:hypothetical protein